MTIHYTIEPSSMFEPDGCEGFLMVYEWGIYDPSSVLAGQERKTFCEAFPNVASALQRYPQAQVLECRRPVHNTVAHLPGDDDADEEGNR